MGLFSMFFTYLVQNEAGALIQNRSGWWNRLTERFGNATHNLMNTNLGEVADAVKNRDGEAVKNLAQRTFNRTERMNNLNLDTASSEQLQEISKVIGDDGYEKLLKNAKTSSTVLNAKGEPSIVLPLDELPPQVRDQVNRIRFGMSASSGGPSTTPGQTVQQPSVTEDGATPGPTQANVTQAVESGVRQGVPSSYTYQHREIVGSSLLDPRTYMGKDNTFFTNMAKDAKALATEFKPQSGEGTLSAGKRALGNQQVAHGTVNLMARGMVGLGVANVVKGVALGTFDTLTGDSQAADEHFSLAGAHAGGVAKTAVTTRAVGFLAKHATKALPFLSKGVLGRIPIIGGVVTYYFGRQEIAAVQDMVNNGQATQQMLENTKTAVTIQSIGNVLPFGIAGEVARDAYALYSGARDGGGNKPNYGLTGSLVQGALGLIGIADSPVAHAPSNPLALSKAHAANLSPSSSAPIAAPVNTQVVYTPTHAPATPSYAGMRPVYVGH